MFMPFTMKFLNVTPCHIAGHILSLITLFNFVLFFNVISGRGDDKA
uniref:Uncharacterized protein n=1 Tax=Arundo donax TaxID=35708 RepID=A0A0A9E6U5_ARUDO